MALGKDITGRPVFGDLGKMPHLLVAGATGSGKSVCLNTIIASLLVSATPDQVQMLMIDPKRVELTVYNGIPHLIKDVITDARLAAGALFEMTKEMDTRYERFAKAGVRKIEEYNAKFPDETLPYVVIIIDELADLMLVAPAKVETTIMRLAQLARATGIHLDRRDAAAVGRRDHRLDQGQHSVAHRLRRELAGRLAHDSRHGRRGTTARPRRHAVFADRRAQADSRAGRAHHRQRGEPARRFLGEAGASRESGRRRCRAGRDDDGNGKKDVDPLCYDAAKFIIESNYASTAQLQSQFSIGHPRAVRLMKQLEEFKVVGPHEGTKPRKILLGLAELEVIAPRLGQSDEAQQDLFGS